MQAVDKDQVRMLVTAVGYRQASLQTGIKEPTLRKWAERGGWNSKRVKPIPHAQKTVTTVTKPADALAQTLADDNAATRTGLSAAARKAAVHAASMTPVQVIKSSRGLRDVADIASKVHQWDQRSGGGVNVFGQAVVITDEQVADLRARLRRLRGEDEGGD